MKKILFLMLSGMMAVFSCGNKEPSKTALESPSGLTVEAVSESSAKLSWTHDGEGVGGWWVFIRREGDAFYVAPLNADAPLPAPDRSYIFEGLNTGEAYTFGVQAVPSSESLSSQPVYAKQYTVPVPEVTVDPDVSPDPEAIPLTLTADKAGKRAEFKSRTVLGEDLLITFAPVSANKTVQIDRYEIGDEAFASYTDWIGPYGMRTVAATSQTDKAYGFTGGWHASNGDGTGDPTAETQAVEIFIGDQPFPSGSITGNQATVVVYNKVEAANTKFDESKRFVIDETVTYTMKEGRLYVRVDITALEDVNISLYYGMQIAGGFSKKFTFLTEDGQTFETTESYFCQGKVRDMTGYSNGGHSVTAHMFDEGLGTFSKATPAYSALVQYYGVGNGKGYYMLIGDMQSSSNSCKLKISI